MGRRDVAHMRADNEAAEQTGAAVKIQAIQRGKQQRAELADQQAAAVKIQAVHRGKATRGALSAQDLRPVDAAEGLIGAAFCDCSWHCSRTISPLLFVLEHLRHLPGICFAPMHFQ